MPAQFKEVSHVTSAQKADAPLPPADLPTTCRCCGGRLDAKFQASYRPEKPGFWLLTCWNKACGIYSVTRSDVTYSTFDLEPYLVK